MTHASRFSKRFFSVRYKNTGNMYSWPQSVTLGLAILTRNENYNKQFFFVCILKIFYIVIIPYAYN